MTQRLETSTFCQWNTDDPNQAAAHPSLVASHRFIGRAAGGQFSERRLVPPADNAHEPNHAKEWGEYSKIQSGVASVGMRSVSPPDSMAPEYPRRELGTVARPMR